MASILQIAPTITPAVVKKILGPLPAGVPAPPPGMNYEVVATPGGGAAYTGNLIPTNRTTTTVIDNPAFTQFLQVGGLVAGIAGGEALTALPALAQKVAPFAIKALTGGLPPWVSSTISSQVPAARSPQALTRLKAFLVAAIRARRLSIPQAVSIFRGLTAS